MSIIDPPRSFLRDGRRYAVEKAGRWDENSHPRDRLGRFIETGAEVRVWGGRGGRVVRNVGGGRIEIVRDDGSHAIVHRNYLTVTARPDGSAPTAQQGDNVADLPEQAPEKPDAEEIAIPDEPTPGADTVRDSGTELAAAIDDPKLAEQVRANTAAYHAAVTNNVPDDEADERAALRQTLDRVSSDEPAVTQLVNDVWAAAATDPASPPAETPSAPETDVPAVDAPETDAPEAPAGPSIGDQLDQNSDQTINAVMTNGDTVTGRVVDRSNGNVDIEGTDGVVARVRETDIDRVDRATPGAAEGNGTISDPDDPSGEPTYEGPLDQAHTQLAPGEYDASDENGNPVTVTVTDDSSTVSPQSGNEPEPAADEPAADPPVAPSAPANNDDPVVVQPASTPDPGVPLPPIPPPPPGGGREDRVRLMQEQARQQAGFDERWRVRGNIYSTSVDKLREGDVIYTQGDGSQAQPVQLPSTSGGNLNPWSRKPRTVARVERNGTARIVHFTDGTSTGTEGGSVEPQTISGRISVAGVPLAGRLDEPATRPDVPTPPDVPETPAVPDAPAGMSLDDVRQRLRDFAANVPSSSRVATTLTRNARGIARARDNELRLSPSGGIIARRDPGGGWVPYAIGNANRLSDSTVRFTDTEIDDVLKRLDDLGIPFGNHDAVLARWNDSAQRRTDATALRAIGTETVAARVAGGEPAFSVPRGRFANVAAVQRHLLTSANTAVQAIATDPMAKLSGSGRLIIHRDADGQRGWRVSTTHSGKRINERLFGTSDEALEFADRTERNLLDKDGAAYPFDGAMGERRLRTWVSARYERVYRVINSSLANTEPQDPDPADFTDDWSRQRTRPTVDIPDDLTSLTDEEITELQSRAFEQRDTAARDRLIREQERRRRADRLARMSRALTPEQEGLFVTDQPDADRETAERNMRDTFSFTHSNGWKIDWHRVTPGEERSSLAGYIKDDQGRRVGEVQRSVILRPNGELEVHHDFLAINSEHQGQGFADAYYKHLYEQYERRGIDVVTIQANIDVGGYAWAQRGFEWDADEPGSYFLSRALQNIDNIDMGGMSEADKARIAQFRKDVADRKFTPKQMANALSDIRWTKTVDSGAQIQMWPGKAAMLGTNWYGQFRVGDRESGGNEAPAPERPVIADTEVLKMSDDALGAEGSTNADLLGELMNVRRLPNDDPDVVRLVARQQAIGEERNRRIVVARSKLIPDGEEVGYADLKPGDTVVVPFITDRGPEIATVDSVYGNQIRVRYDDGTERSYIMIGTIANAKWRRATAQETTGGTETVGTGDLKVGDRLLLDDGITARIDAIGEPVGDRVLLDVTDDNGQAREIEADRHSGHIRVTSDDPPEVTRPDIADMDDDALMIEAAVNEVAGADSPEHPLYARQQAITAEQTRRVQEANRPRLVEVRQVRRPTARPRLYTYQRKNLVALGLDSEDSGASAQVQQAAARVRARKPLTAAQATALANHIRQVAAAPDVRVRQQRSLTRLAATFDTAAAVAAGRRPDAPQPGNDRVQRVKGTALTGGDTAIIRAADGSLVTARVMGSQSMMRGTLARVTYTDDEGNIHARIIDRDADVWLMPDLPPDKPTPVEPLPGTELIYGEDVRVGDTIAYLRGGRYFEDRIESLSQQGNDFFAQMDSGTEVTFNKYELRTRAARGPESVDQAYLYSVQPLDKSEMISGEQVEIGDRIVVDVYDPPARGTVTGVTVVEAAGGVEGRRIEFIDDSGTAMNVTVFASMDFERVARAADNATATLQALAAERATRERTAGVVASLTKIQTTAIRAAVADLAHVADSGRAAVLAALRKDIDDGGFASSRTIQGLMTSLDTENMIAVAALGYRLAGDSLERLYRSIEEAQPVGEESEQEAVKRVLQQHLMHPPTRHSRQIAQSLLANSSELNDVQTPAATVVVPALPEGALPDRISSYRRALGGEFGSATVRAATYKDIDFDALERGEAPRIDYFDTQSRDLAADGGPGENTMRQLEIVRAAGADLDASLQDRVEAKMRAAGVTWDDARDLSLTAYMAQLQDMATALEAANREAYNRTVRYGSGPNREQADHDFHESYRERQRVLARLNELEAPHTQAQRDAVRELLAEIRPVGGVRLAYQEAEPETGPSTRGAGRPLSESDENVRAMRTAEDVLPTDWLNAVQAALSSRYGRTAMGLGETERGFADWAGNIRLSGHGYPRFEGDTGRGYVAVHELGHLAERHVPGIMAAENAFLWSRTSTGDVGAREREAASTVMGPQNGFRDDFRNRYTGVDYRLSARGAVESYEVISTGVESLFAGAKYLDEDMRRFLLGTLALL